MTTPMILVTSLNDTCGSASIRMPLLLKFHFIIRLNLRQISRKRFAPIHFPLSLISTMIFRSGVSGGDWMMLIARYVSLLNNAMAYRH